MKIKRGVIRRVFGNKEGSMNDTEKLKKIIAESDNIVFFGGERFGFRYNETIIKWR